MTKRNKFLLAGTAAVLGLALVTGGAYAGMGGWSGHGGMHGGMHGGGMGGGMGMADKMFTMFDTDNNDAISKAEVEQVRKEQLAKYDVDKDGKLNLDEFQGLLVSMMRERFVDHFQRLDNDGDAAITEAELAKPLDRMMTWMDRNKDGSITMDELRRTDRHKGGKHHGYDNDDD